MRMTTLVVTTLVYRPQTLNYFVILKGMEDKLTTWLTSHLQPADKPDGLM